MSLPQKTGTYWAKVAGIGVEEKDSGAVFANVALELESLQLPGGATDPTPGQTITAYMNVIGTNANGNKISEITVRQLTDSLGWDGVSFSALQGNAYNGTVVQAVLEEDTWGNKTTIKVRYLNPKDYSPGGPVKKADDSSIRLLDAKFGTMLRAINGNKAGAAAKKPINVNAPIPPGGSPLAIGREIAWKNFNALIDQHNANSPDDAYTEDDRKSVFKKVVLEIATPKTPNDLTAEEWAALNKEMSDKFSAATRELLPF